MRLLALPQPYDFEASTERFRTYGRDHANVWHDGGLHRVIAGREVRVEAASGGVRIEPGDDAARSHDLVASGCSSRSRRVLGVGCRRPGARGSSRPPERLPAAARRGSVGDARHVDHRPAGVAALRLRRALATDRAVRDKVREAWSFPTRERLAAASEDEIRAVGLSMRKAEYVVGLARGDLDLDGLDTMTDDEVVEAITAQRGLGRWTADWFLARALGRRDAWPAGDLAVRKAVSLFYGEGRDLDETEVRDVGERFGSWRNIACHMLLAGARVHG